MASSGSARTPSRLSAGWIRGFHLAGGLPWLGDALPQALILAAMSNDLRPLRQVLTMAADGAYRTACCPACCRRGRAYAIVDYDFMWVELLALYHRLTGDEGLVAEFWPALTKMLARFRQDVGADGLIVSQPGRRLFLDWAPRVPRQEPNAIYRGLRYLLALQTAARLAQPSQRPEDAAAWQIEAATLQTILRHAFWADGHWWDDLSAHHLFAVGCGLCPPDPDRRARRSGRAAGRRNAARSLDLDDSYTPGKLVLASPFMHHYLFEALREGGWDVAVIEIIRRRWGRWVKAGYPTTWENWNVDFPDGSQCHTFSAHPRVHLSW